jgi:hypothetical protein
MGRAVAETGRREHSVDSAEGLQRLRDKLGVIDRENTERFALIDKRAGKATQESRDTTARLASNADEVLNRLNERAQRIKNAGGWATGSSVATSAADEDEFGFEEDDHVAPPPPATSGRHLRREPVEEDDYAETDWTSD